MIGYLFYFSEGLDTSHILYLMNKWDDRVAPLVYTIRIWAAQNNVTCLKRPAPFITNFSMMFMVIFFLQNEQILPSLHSFNSLPGEYICRPLFLAAFVVDNFS